MTELEIPGAPKPYQHLVQDHRGRRERRRREPRLRRRRGAIATSSTSRRASASARPSSTTATSSCPRPPSSTATSAINLPLEATPRIARRAAWLVTDSAYKEALIQLRAKLEARKAGGVARATDVPAWTAEKPVVSEDPVLVAPLESLDELETRAKALSAVFRDQPVLRDSRVAVTSYLERRWYLTTEGTSVTDTRRASGIVIAASGQADDGQLLHQYFLRYGHTAKDLPSDDELKAEVEEARRRRSPSSRRRR